MIAFLSWESINLRYLPLLLTNPFTNACSRKHPKTKQHSPIAQSVERPAVNRQVVGSSPTWGAKSTSLRTCAFLFVFSKTNNHANSVGLPKPARKGCLGSFCFFALLYFRFAIAWGYPSQPARAVWGAVSLLCFTFAVAVVTPSQPARAVWGAFTSSLCCTSVSL